MGNEETKTGFFAIRLAKKGFEHGLEVRKQDGLFYVFVNGELKNMPSENVEEAFQGLIYEGGLSGRPISGKEYSRLSAARVQDLYDGHDPNQATDLNLVRPIF